MTLRRVSATMWAMVVAIAAAGADPIVASAAAVTPLGLRLDVTVDSGRLSVRADGVRLADVLEAVGREAHVTIVLRGALDALVSEKFASVSVEEGLRRLTRWQSVVMIYDSSPGTQWSSSGAAEASVLTEVWVTSALPPPRSTEQAGQDTRRDLQSQAGRPVTGSASASRPIAGSASINMTVALNQVNPEARKQMLETLVREQSEYVVVGALREAAMVSASPVLRYRAVQTLESMHTADAIDALRTIVNTYRETATANPDPRIRRGAIQGLAEITAPEAFEALRAALNDPNPGVATEARRALGRQSRGSGRDSIR